MASLPMGSPSYLLVWLSALLLQREGSCFVFYFILFFFTLTLSFWEVQALLQTVEGSKFSLTFPLPPQVIAWMMFPSPLAIYNQPLQPPPPTSTPRIESALSSSTFFRQFNGKLTENSQKTRLASAYCLLARADSLSSHPTEEYLHQTCCSCLPPPARLSLSRMDAGVTS